METQVGASQLAAAPLLLWSCGVVFSQTANRVKLRSARRRTGAVRGTAGAWTSVWTVPQWCQHEWLNQSSPAEIGGRPTSKAYKSDKALMNE